VLTLLLLGGGAALSHAAADVPAGTVLGALAAVTGAAFGVVLLGPPFGAAHVLVAAAVAVLVAATGPALVDGGDAVFVGLGLTALLALLGGGLVLLAGATPAEAAAVVAPLALALTTAAPTVALRLSRIPRPPLPRTAADLAEVPGQLDLDRVLDRVRRARALLSGLVAGCYAAATLGVAVLTSDTTTVWSAVLAAVLTILMLLRARLFRQRAQVAAPLVGVAVILLAAIVAVTRGSADSVLLTVVLPVALVLAVVAGAFGVWGGRRPLNPRLSRALDVLETLLLLAVVPLALAVWDVYTLLLEIRA
jgi:type VII secretion integral membrane protein EccD